MIPMFLVERNLATLNNNVQEKIFPEQDDLAFPKIKRIFILSYVSTDYEGYVIRTRSCIGAISISGINFH